MNRADIERAQRWADIRWARRIATTRVVEAAAGIREEHGRLIGLTDLRDALIAYDEGERNGFGRKDVAA